MTHTTISISTWAIIKIALVILGLWFLYLIREVAVMMFAAVILYTVLRSAVSWLEGKRMPRGLSVLLIYIVLLAVLAGIIGLVVPPVAREVGELVQDLPILWNSAMDKFSDIRSYTQEQGFYSNIQELFSALEGWLTNASRGIFSGIMSLFGGIASFLIILVMTFYLLTEERAIKKFFETVIPRPYQGVFFNLAGLFQQKMQGWAKGSLVLMMVIFLLIYIGLTILQVPYALVLALLAGILEIVPYIGPLTSAIPILFLAFTQSPLTGLLTLALIVVVQQLENHLIAPKVMKQAVGLNPIVSIISVIAGAKLAGFVGVLLAIPVALVVSIFIKEFLMSESVKGTNNE